MTLRSVTVLVALAAAIALAGVANAQPYPVPARPLPSHPVPPYPVPAVPDDDDPDEPVYPPHVTPSPYGRAPYERGPYDRPYSQEPRRPATAGRPIERQDLPPPGVSDPYGRTPPFGSPYGSLPAPRDSYQRDPNVTGSIPPQPYGAQPNPYAAPQGPMAITPGPDAVRPPGDVGPPGVAPREAAPQRPAQVAALPPEEQPEEGAPKQLPEHLRRQLVDYRTAEPAGTLVIDTANTYLYLVLGNGKAMRYGIGVGREGFTWSGTERVSKMTEWPDWHPPKEMIERQPYLPRFMAGGLGNPLGARALYLGKTLYRIHGTNQPSTIGSFVSSGCIRLTNEDIQDLYGRVQVGSRVVVLPGGAPVSANVPQGGPVPRQQR